MAVYKRGYQRYQGALTSQWSRLMVLPRFAWERLMQQRQVRRLPVINDAGTLIGILSLSDVAQGVGRDGKAGRPEGIDLLTTIAAISEPRENHWPSS